jgi:hypothetical protein
MNSVYLGCSYSNNCCSVRGRMFNWHWKFWWWWNNQKHSNSSTFPRRQMEMPSLWRSQCSTHAILSQVLRGWSFLKLQLKRQIKSTVCNRSEKDG